MPAHRVKRAGKTGPPTWGTGPGSTLGQTCMSETLAAGGIAQPSLSQIIDPAHLDADGRCVFGATVELEDVDSRETVTYQIVGDDEADIKQGKISVGSPIARAIIGKYAGDQVEVQTPGGVRKYEVLDVRYE